NIEVREPSDGARVPPRDDRAGIVRVVVAREAARRFVDRLTPSKITPDLEAMAHALRNRHLQRVVPRRSCKEGRLNLGHVGIYQQPGHDGGGGVADFTARIKGGGKAQGCLGRTTVRRRREASAANRVWK